MEWSVVSPHFFCTLSPALYVFLNPSSSTLARSTSLYPSIHLYPSSSSLPHLYFLFLPHPSTLYSPQSPPPLSKAIPDVAEWAPIAFCHFFFGLCYRKWAPFEKRKEERRKRVVGFRGALRKGRPKCNSSTLTHSHTTCVHGLNCRRAQMHPHMLLRTSSLQALSMVASSPHPRLFLLPAFLEALFSKVRKREPAGKRDEGEGLHFRRNVVLELESE